MKKENSVAKKKKENSGSVGKTIIKWCTIVLAILTGVALIAYGVYLFFPKDTNTDEELNSNVEITYGDKNETSVKGIKFNVKKNWVVDKQPTVSQVIIYHDLADYNNDGINAISITSSWVEKDFNISDYAQTFCDALKQSDTVASAELSSFSIGDYQVYNISMVNNGAFGGYAYLMKGNVIVEILYGTQDVDNLDSYRNDVNDIIASMEFTGKAKKEDFPEPSEDESSEESSKVESSKVESSFTAKTDFGDGDDSANEDSSVSESTEVSGSESKSDDTSTKETNN